MNNVYMKLLLSFIVAIVLYQTFRYSQSTTFHLYNKRTTNEFRISSWSCEVDRRLVVELQEEIRAKDKLLKYREKVIGDLRQRLKKLNSTVSTLQSRSLVNSAEEDLIDREKREDETQSREHRLYDSNISTTPFPPDMDKRASRTKKPCCIALKRMTDILRTYMQRTNDLKDQISVLQTANVTELMAKMAKLEEQKLHITNCSMQPNPEIETNEKDALFTAFDRKYIYEATPVYVDLKRKIGKGHWGIHQDVELNRAYNLAMGQITASKKLSGRDLSIFSGLMKVNAMSGLTYTFLITSNVTNHTYMATVERNLGPFSMVGELQDVTPKIGSMINIIVPLSGRGDRLKQFLDMIYIVCIKKHINVFLTVVIYGKNSKEIKHIIKDFSRTTGFQSYDILRKDDEFARGRALHDGVLRWNGDSNVVMFFCDVDITFDVAFLQRCALFANPGKSVYFPVVFSLYNPDIVSLSFSKPIKGNKSYRINRETGIWRSLGYGMACVTRSDYLEVGGFDLTIEGWGGEDVALYQRFVSSSLKVIRAPDSGLFHKYHPKDCDFKSLGPLKYKQCLGSKARYEASQRQLGLLLFANENKALLSQNDEQQ